MFAFLSLSCFLKFLISLLIVFNSLNSESLNEPESLFNLKASRCSIIISKVSLTFKFNRIAVVLPSALIIRSLYRVLLSSSFLAISLFVPGEKYVGASSAISDKLLGGDLSKGTSRILTTDSTLSMVDNSSLSCFKWSIVSAEKSSFCG